MLVLVLKIVLKNNIKFQKKIRKTMDNADSKNGILLGVGQLISKINTCLLYTSDAADE